MDNISDKTRKHMDKLVQSTHKIFGNESLHLLGSSKNYDIDVISTGCLSLDVALGVGGIPKGRIIEIFGPESSGKTTLVQHIIAEAQKLGGFCVFIDTEHALDPIYAEKCGVKIDQLFISQPDSGEQALEIVDNSLNFYPSIIVIDSVAALVPRAEIEGQMGDSHMGLHARLMSQGLRKLIGRTKKSNTTIIFTNQLRDKIGGFAFGPQQTTTGGNALKFYASIRLDIRRIQTLKNKNVSVANRTKVVVKKNKVAPPLKVAEFDIVYNEGISKIGDLIDLAVNYEIIEKKGAFYSYGEQRLSQGRENARQFLINNPKMLIAIENALRSKLRLPLKIEE